jgi:hypothetical protein
MKKRRETTKGLLSIPAAIPLQELLLQIASTTAVALAPETEAETIVYNQITSLPSEIGMKTNLLDLNIGKLIL